MSFFKPILPFILLIVGYAAAAWWWRVVPVPVPELRGLSVREALCAASHAGFALECVELGYADEQKVIEQTPLPGTRVKRRRVITVAIPQQPAVVRIPGCVGLRRVDAEKVLHKACITQIEWVAIESDLPEGLVLLQDPEAGAAGDSVVCLVAAPRDARVCMPRLSGRTYGEVLSFLDRSGIALDCGGVGHCDECIIDKQWPDPGAVIDRRRLTHVFCTLRCPKRHAPR